MRDFEGGRDGEGGGAGERASASRFGDTHSCTLHCEFKDMCVCARASLRFNSANICGAIRLCSTT